MQVFVVDVEADGPCPGLYSMVSFAAVRLQRGELGCYFRGEVAPITDRFEPDYLQACHVTREAHQCFEAADIVMPRFVSWLRENSDGRRPVFVSDNPAFDWQFMNYYLHAFTGCNPFGHSARRIGDLHAGIQRNFRERSDGWRHMMKTQPTHDPLDDALGNAEALLALNEQYGLNVPLALTKPAAPLPARAVP